eukprot:660718-Rhodomonas_salina.1
MRNLHMRTAQRVGGCQLHPFRRHRRQHGWVATQTCVAELALAVVGVEVGVGEEDHDDRALPNPLLATARAS